MSIPFRRSSSLQRRAAAPFREAVGPVTLEPHSRFLERETFRPGVERFERLLRGLGVPETGLLGLRHGRSCRADGPLLDGAR